MNRTTWNNQITFSVGDTVKIHQNIVEGKKKRIQIFKGIVIGIKGHQGLTSFIVRKISLAGIGVEKIYPLNTPTINKIEVVKRGKVRRAKLYYLRNRIGKKATKVQDYFVKASNTVNTDQPEITTSTKQADEKEEKIGDKKEEHNKPNKNEIKSSEANTKAELKREARARRKAKKKKKVERKERKDIR